MRDPPPYALPFYEASVDYAARSAVRAFMAYGDAIKDETQSIDAAIFLHDALTHCASISRFFWPTRSSEFAINRGKELRERYDIKENSPLADRSLRNTLEHFDERLDEWLKKDPVGPIIASPIFGDHTLIDDGFGHVFKLIDIENDIFVILGQKFKFAPIAEEVARILIDGRKSGGSKRQ